MQLAGLAARRGIRLEMHAEPRAPDGELREDEVFGGVGALSAHHPKLKLILSRTGMTNAVNARELLQGLSQPDGEPQADASGKPHGWDILEPVVNRHRLPFRNWTPFMEEMSTRFMVGTDSQNVHRHFLPYGPPAWI